MRVSAITKTIESTPEGQIITEVTNPCNIDQGEILSWTTLHDEDGVPDYVVVITKNGISMDIEYNEDVLSNLAAEFRSRGVL